jgi:hypothetical protein
VFRSLTASTALAALALTLAGGLAAAPALADTAPAPGTSGCTSLVNAQSAVATLQAAVNTATGTLAADQAAGATPATIANDSTGPLGVQTLTAQLDVLKTTTAKQLCTGTAAGSSTTTTTATPDPTSPPVVPRTRSQADITREIAALSCTSGNSDLQAIDRHIAARQVARQDTHDVVARLNAKLASLSCASGAVTPRAAAQTAHDCGCVTTTESPAPDTSSAVSSKTVVATASDGSVPTLSGQQVTVAPSGSAQTGAA